jgi:hypothetical protein
MMPQIRSKSKANRLTIPIIQLKPHVPDRRDSTISKRRASISNING